MVRIQGLKNCSRVNLVRMIRPACRLVLCFMFYSYVSNSKPLAILFVVSGLASYVLGAVLNNVFHVGV